MFTNLRGKRSRTNSLSSIVALSAVGIFTMTVSGCATSSDRQSAPSHTKVVVADGDDRLPSQTSSDWVTYADYVVVVRPTSEVFGQPTKEEVSRGEGSVLRDLTMSVTKVLWSSPSAPVHAPAESFTYPAYGYAFNNGELDQHTPMVGGDESRLEIGHTYIMALNWQAERCTEDDYIAGGWKGLGSGSTLPFDGDVIGNGEYEGQTIDPKEYKARFATEGAGSDLAPSLAGQSDEDLVKALNVAKTEQKQDYLPPAAPCSAESASTGS